MDCNRWGVLLPRSPRQDQNIHFLNSQRVGCGSCTGDSSASPAQVGSMLSIFGAIWRCAYVRIERPGTHLHEENWRAISARISLRCYWLRPLRPRHSSASSRAHSASLTLTAEPLTGPSTGPRVTFHLSPVHANLT